MAETHVPLESSVFHDAVRAQCITGNDRTCSFLAMKGDQPVFVKGPMQEDQANTSLAIHWLDRHVFNSQLIPPVTIERLLPDLFPNTPNGQRKVYFTGSDRGPRPFVVSPCLLGCTHVRDVPTETHTTKTLYKDEIVVDWARVQKDHPDWARQLAQAKSKAKKLVQAGGSLTQEDGKPKVPEGWGEVGNFSPSMRHLLAETVAIRVVTGCVDQAYRNVMVLSGKQRVDLPPGLEPDVTRGWARMRDAFPNDPEVGTGWVWSTDMDSMNTDKRRDGQPVRRQMGHRCIRGGIDARKPLKDAMETTQFKARVGEWQKAFESADLKAKFVAEFDGKPLRVNGSDTPAAWWDFMLDTVKQLDAFAEELGLPAWQSNKVKKRKLSSDEESENPPAKRTKKGK